MEVQNILDKCQCVFEGDIIDHLKNCQQYSNVGNLDVLYFIKDTYICVKCPKACKTLQSLMQVCPHIQVVGKEPKTFLKIPGQLMTSSYFMCTHCYVIYNYQEKQSVRRNWERHINTHFQQIQEQIQGSISQNVDVVDGLAQNDLKERQYFSQGHQNSHHMNSLMSSKGNPGDFATALFSAIQFLILQALRQVVQKHPSARYVDFLPPITREAVQFNQKCTQIQIVQWNSDYLAMYAGNKEFWEENFPKPDQLLHSQNHLNNQLKIIKNTKGLKTFNKIIRYLGKLKGAHPQLKVTLPAVDQNAVINRCKSIVKISDIMKIIEALVGSTNKQLVFHGLDIWLLFSSGLRSTDWQRFRVALLEAFQQNKNVLSVGVHKTNAKASIIIPSQLFKILKQVKWDGFGHLISKSYKRWRKIFGITFYNLKNILVQAIVDFQTISGKIALYQDAMIIVGHRLKKTTQRYALGSQEDSLTRRRQFAQLLQINTLPHYNHTEIDTIITLQNQFDRPEREYYALKENWLQNLFQKYRISDIKFTLLTEQAVQKRLLFANPSQMDNQSQSDSDQGSVNSNPAILQNVQLEVPSIVQNQQEAVQVIDSIVLPIQVPNSIILPVQQSNISTQQLQRSPIQLIKKPRKHRNVTHRISSSKKALFSEYKGDFIQFSTYGTQCHLYANGFHPLSFLTEDKGKYFCIFCAEPTQKHCICYQSKPKKALNMTVPTKTVSGLKLTFKATYLKKQLCIQQLIFMQLMALRHFQYTATSCAFGLSLSQIDIKQFKEWGTANIISNGKSCNINDLKESITTSMYFPPIKLYVYQSYQVPIWGRCLGIKASQDIPQNTFLGQYASDFFFKRDAKLIKKPDSVFSFGQKMYLAPIVNCGWTPLINSPNQGQIANCQSRPLILFGRPAIVLFTIARVNADQQLLYNYGSTYDPSYLRLQQSDDDDV